MERLEKSLPVPIRIYLLGALAALLVSIAPLGRVFAQSDIYDTYSGFSVPTTPVLPSHEIHPCLFFTASQMPAIRAKKDSDSYANQLWTSIQNNIKSYEQLDPAAQSYTDLSQMAKYCAFSWIMNNDTLGLQKAIGCLMIAYHNVPRTANSTDFDKPFDEIYRASWLQNFCEAYDWVQPQLTAQQDSTIRALLIQEVLILRDNMVTGADYAPRPHNHRSKPAYAIGTAALTFSSDTAAPDWMQFSLEMENTVTKYMFSSDGIYREGPHYFMYTAVNMIPFLWQYERVSGVNLFPYYKHAFEWPVLIRNTDGWMPNIEDSGLQPFPTDMVAAAYMNTPTRLSTDEPLGKVLEWSWFHTKLFTKNYTGATNDVAWDIDEYLTYEPSIPQAAPDVSPTLSLQTGQVVFRNNWNYNDPSNIYMLFQGVAASNNHDHPDGTSYVMDAHNSVLATAPGYGKDGFSDPLRSSWYITGKANNLVTVNGAAPVDWQTNVGPTDMHFLNAPFYAFSEKETALPVADGTIRRGIAFPDQKFFVVYDLTSAPAAYPYDLNIHGRGTLAADSNKFTWTTTNDKYGSAAKLFTYVLPDTAAMTIQSGYTSLYEDQYPQSYVQVAERCDSAMYMHLLYPGLINATFPQVEKINTENALAFQVDPGDTASETFCLQRNNVHKTVSDFQTDAIFTWEETRNSSLKYFSMNDGTSFSWEGRRIFLSQYPVCVAADLSGNINGTFYIDTLSESTTMTFYPFNVADSIRQVLINGVPAYFSRVDGGGVSVYVNRSGPSEINLSSVITGVKSPAQNIPSGFWLSANYPNPFNPSTEIQFAIPESGLVTMNVYDITGRLVQTLLQKEMPAGRYTESWNGENSAGEMAASGVYIFRITFGTKVLRTKALLLK